MESGNGVTERKDTRQQYITQKCMEELENLRKKIQFVREWHMGWICAIAMAGCAAAKIANRVDLYLALLVVSVILFGLISSADNNEKKFKQIYKENLVPELLSEYLENVWYRWKEGFEYEEVKQIGLALPFGTEKKYFSSEDFLRAWYKGVMFEQADICMDNEWHLLLGRKGSKYFQGRMFVLHAQMKQVRDVWVLAKNFRNRLALPDGMAEVKLEQMEFNSRFDVLAADSHEAFYVLTPPVMERIAALLEKYENVAVRFSGNVIRVAYSRGNDAFDADLSSPITYEKENFKIYSDIREITDLIDLLQLEGKIIPKNRKEFIDENSRNWYSTE